MTATQRTRRRQRPLDGAHDGGSGGDDGIGGGGGVGRAGGGIGGDGGDAERGAASEGGT